MEKHISCEIQGHPWPFDEPLPFGLACEQSHTTLYAQIKDELRRRKAFLIYHPEYGWDLVPQEDDDTRES